MEEFLIRLKRLYFGVFLGYRFDTFLIHFVFILDMLNLFRIELFAVVWRTVFHAGCWSNNHQKLSHSWSVSTHCGYILYSLWIHFLIHCEVHLVYTLVNICLHFVQYLDTFCPIFGHILANIWAHFGQYLATFLAVFCIYFTTFLLLFPLSATF